MSKALTEQQALDLLKTLATKRAMQLSKRKALEVGAALEASVEGCKRRQGAWLMWQIELDGYDVRLTIKDGERSGQLTLI